MAEVGFESPGCVNGDRRLFGGDEEKEELDQVGEAREGSRAEERGRGCGLMERE